MSVVVRIETGGAVLTLVTLDLTVEVADDAGEGAPLAMRVRTDGCGVSVEALNNGDSGTWDTDYIDVPADTPEDRLEEAVREAVAKIDWRDGEAPVLVGLYCAGGEYDEEEML
jgi:hypothetical protein